MRKANLVPGAGNYDHRRKVEEQPFPMPVEIARANAEHFKIRNEPKKRDVIERSKLGTSGNKG